jgi:two-component system, cell cycle response regulator
LGQFAVDSDIKTRVAPLEELQSTQPEGQDCLVVIYSSDPRVFGTRHVLDDHPVLMGRGAENTLVLEGDSISRRHARIERRANSYNVVDLQSTNGTYVNDELIDGQCQLRKGDQIKIGDTILKYLSGSDVETQYHETIYRMTIVDGLTGVNNKRFLMETLDREISRARRHKRPLALMMFDIDHFKPVNDNFGHLAGDYVLKEMAQAVRNRLRPDDVVARYGGEEFAVVFPETPLEGAVEIAEKLRKLVADHRFEFERERMKITISGGVAMLEEGMDVMQLLKAADERLYDAKRSGRNRVCS